MESEIQTTRERGDIFYPVKVCKDVIRLYHNRWIAIDPTISYDEYDVLVTAKNN